MSGQRARPRTAGSRHVRFKAGLVAMFVAGCGGASASGPASGPGAAAERSRAPEAGQVPGEEATATGTPRLDSQIPRVRGPDPAWREPEAATVDPEAPLPYGPLTLRQPASPVPSGFPVRIAATAGVDGPPWRGPLRWESSDPLVLRVSQSGVAIGYAPGSAWITATPVAPAEAGAAEVPEPEAEANAAIAPEAAFDPEAAADLDPAAAVRLTVVPDRARILTVSPAEAAVVSGQVLHLTAEVRAIDGRELEDGRVHWSSTPIDAERAARVDPDGAFVAQTPGTWLVTATRGGLSASSVVRVSARPDSVMLEPLASALPPGPFATSAGVRVFEGMDGRDWAWVWTDAPSRLHVWDVSDPGAPAFVRTLDPGAERINDLEIGAGATWAVAALGEGPLVVFDLSDPSDPTELTRIGEGLPLGASAVAVDRDRVWAGSLADGSLIGFELGDPRVPRRIGSWRPGSGRIADLEVRDGLALLARGSHGLTILDVGAGIRGGSPAGPEVVAEFRGAGPPVREEGAPDAFRVRRWRDWILLGESLRDCTSCVDGPRGGVRLIDVTDVRRPSESAWYRVPEAGVRDLDLDLRGEHLAAAFGTGGARLLDLSGELRGDLADQGREVAAAATGSWWPGVPTRSLARGVRSLKGSLFVADMYAGLRVFRIVTRARDE